MFGAHISQLAHFEVTTPDLAASVAFYRDVLGMEVSAQKPGSVWLRGWGESFHHALQLTAGDAPRRGPYRLAGDQRSYTERRRRDAGGNRMGPGLGARHPRAWAGLSLCLARRP